MITVDSLKELGGLYGLPPGVCPWGGGGGYEEAAEIQAQSAREAAQTYERMFEKAAAFLKPWREAGGTALNQYAGLLGLPGYSAVDPTEWLTSLPGYQFIRDQGMEGLRRYGAGTGLLSSGAAMKGATDYGQQLAQKYAWWPYFSALGGLQSQGQGAAGMTGNWAMQTGQGIAGTQMAAGNALAQGALMDAYSNQGGFSDILGFLGLGAGLLTAPFGGIGGALGGLFGGGAAAAPSAAAAGMSSSLAGMAPVSSLFNMPAIPTTFMAEGGPAVGGRPYVIGEKGPEIFVPHRDGYVIPNKFIPYARYSSFEPMRMAA